MNFNEKRNLLAGLYGNALEWYDFLLYASFAPLFSEIFFPTHIPFISLLATFAVFAIGFLMRPIGGLLIGHYGDHAGRRKALIVSISIMTFATLSIAFLPTLQQAGIIAPILFTILRLIQGIAVGGELPGSATFLIEQTFSNRRGFAGSLVLATAFLGIFAGSFTATILTTIHNDENLYINWRLAYLVGGVLGIIGIYLRVKSTESPEFLKRNPLNELPAMTVCTKYAKKLSLAVLLTSIMAIGNYILIAFVTTFLVKYEQFNLHDALVINFSALLLLTFLIPTFGFLSDYLGRKLTVMIGVVILLVAIFPIFWLLLQKNFHLALMAELMLSVALAPINASVPTIIAEMFPAEIRTSGISIGYNIGQALFGGTAPLVAFSLIEISGNNFSPAWYVFIFAGIVLVTIVFSKMQQDLFFKKS